MADSKMFAPRKTRRRSMDAPPNVSEMRLVLVGKTGAGKSSSGNTILGNDVFRAAVSHSSVTRACCKQKDVLLGRDVTVVDTPGLFDTSLPEDVVGREISKCINMSAPGPHAILLVIKAGLFTAEERDAVNKVEEIFGEDAWKFTIILFTHGDKVKTDFHQALKEAGPELQEILRKVNNRYHVFNNVQVNERGQVLELLDKVEQMVADNGGDFYSNYTYRQVVKLLRQRESELTEFYEKKLEEEIKAVETKYEKLMEAERGRPDIERRRITEIEEVKRYYLGLKSKVLCVVEQMVADDPLEKILNKFHETLKIKFSS